MFCKNVVTLVTWMCKNCSIFSLFKWHCSYSNYSVFSFFFSLSFVLFFLLNNYKNPHIYCYTDTTNFTIFLYNKSGYAATVLQHCASKVLTLCSTIATTVFLFFPSNRFVLFFFSFKYWCKLTFILLYWHNKFHNIFTIIDVSISYIQVEIK